VDRVFLDANVLFSAAYSEASGLTRLWKLEDVELISSGYALDEALRNIDAREHRGRLARLMIDVTVVPEAAAIPAECGKVAEKDRPILAAAIVAGATYLLTGDLTHFGRLYGKTIGGVTILRPGEYLCARGRKRR
jgi:uncharacterized protein